MVNPSEPPFDKAFQAAEGYFQLGMWQDAWAELEELNLAIRHLPRVVVLRVLILNNLEKWEDASLIGKGALRQYQDFGPLYLATAHALRHTQGAAAAKSVLMAGESSLKDEAIFHFMLACYECELGNLGIANINLKRTLELDQSLQPRTLREPDLKPLWDSLGDAE